MIHCRNCFQQRGAAIAGSLFIIWLVTACTSDQSKPLPPPTPDQVRGHADRTFEKLRLEEQERSGQPAVPRY
ncbi:MAG: hypothetical protein CAF41_010085 [Nitrospira sp. CG24A]|nr:MAG: hypothetical protein CAF41_010085 [Nitrospira sp. CG24A]